MTRKTLVPGDGDKRHGLNGYTNLKCRCSICRAANSAYNREARERRALLIAADPTIRPHGVASTYFNYKCRCTPCTEAQNAVSLASYYRVKARREGVS